MSDFIKVSGCDNPDREGDVIFVHGLDGDPIETWRPAGHSGPAWPEWLGEALPDVGVWLLSYAAASTRWKGHAMALADRAPSALALLDIEGLGERPLVFIAHSLGGLLVKQMLRHGHDIGEPRCAKSSPTREASFSYRPRTLDRRSPTGSGCWALSSERQPW